MRALRASAAALRARGLSPHPLAASAHALVQAVDRLIQLQVLVRVPVAAADKAQSSLLVVADSRRLSGGDLLCVGPDWTRMTRMQALLTSCSTQLLTQPYSTCELATVINDAISRDAAAT